ncbi:hypothetical protein [Oceanobacillus sp. FSL K6-0127]|uniref:hypothetical protein n=1 Tax=Oceanobacillus sp. FSL K6-0127 TaxID=2921420 RepID=UPI0030EB8BC7
MKMESKYFFCYDHSAMVKLKKRGFNYIVCALHKTTNNRFWLFERSDMLHEVLLDINS